MIPATGELLEWSLEPLERQQRADSESRPRGLRLASRVAMGVLLLFALAATAVGARALSGPFAMEVVWYGAFFAIIIAAYRYEMARQRRWRRALEKFASVNQLALWPTAEVGERPGTLFEHGRNREATDCIQGTCFGLPYELFSYRFTMGSGKSKTVYQRTVMEFTLSNYFPHLVLDCRLERFGSILPIQFSRNQRIVLEGTFDKSFHLYAPEQYQVAALSIVAPDVMQTLLALPEPCDIELVRDKLYLYWEKAADSPDRYQVVQETVNRLLPELIGKLRRGNVFATDAQDDLHAAPLTSATLENSPWKRYGPHAIVVTIILLTFIAQFSGDAGELPFMLALVVTVFYGMYKYGGQYGR